MSKTPFAIQSSWYFTATWKIFLEGTVFSDWRMPSIVDQYLRKLKFLVSPEQVNKGKKKELLKSLIADTLNNDSDT